jgi:hypothetical protein
MDSWQITAFGAFKNISGASVKNKILTGSDVVSAGHTVLSMLRIEAFDGRTARARCVPRTSYVVLHSSALRPRHDIPPYSKPPALATMSCVSAPHKPCSGSCSYSAFIVSYVANRSQSCLQQAFALTISLPAQARSRLSLRAIRAPSLTLRVCSATQTACLRCATTCVRSPI